MLLLEEIFKSKKLQHSERFNLRVQRSLSWFKKSLELEHDLDLQFISLWIALNALYVQDMNVAQDTQALQQFLNSIHQQDQEDRIDSTLWGKLSPLIARLHDCSIILMPIKRFGIIKIKKSAKAHGKPILFRPNSKSSMLYRNKYPLLY